MTKADIINKIVEDTGLAEKWDDDTALKAEFFGVDPKDKKAMAELTNREITTDDLLEAEGDSDRFALALELQKRQRSKAKKSVDENFKQTTSGKKSNGYGLTDADPYTDAMKNAKGYDLGESPFAGSPAAREAANISAARGNVDNSRTDRSSKTTNITQTININGAKDPPAVGQEVAKQTAQMARNQNNQGVY